MAGGGEEGGKREAGAGPGSYITIVNHWGRSFYTNLVYWLDRIFEISNHILENAFSQYKVSKIMLKLLINCL